MFVVKLSNGRGFEEWYESPFVRVQARKKQHATQFKTLERAQEEKAFCQRHPSSFSEIYYDWNRNEWTLTATVEPA